MRFSMRISTKAVSASVLSAFLLASVPARAQEQPETKRVITGANFENMIKPNSAEDKPQVRLMFAGCASVGPDEKCTKPKSSYIVIPCNSLDRNPKVFAASVWPGQRVEFDYGAESAASSTLKKAGKECEKLEP
jgi:hypothetical protein